MSSRKPKNHFLWVTDPWHTLDHSRDTSLRLASEAVKLGYENFWCDVRTVSLHAEVIVLKAQKFTAIDQLGETQIMHPSEFKSIQYRTDPPVDLAYLHPLQLLAQGISRNTEIVNPPAILFSANEKFEGALLKGWMPESLVTSQWDELLSFGKSERKTVLKPLHQAQSKGVELLDWRTKDSTEHAKRLLTEATDQFRKPVLLQRYLEGISEGETRLWFLDGKLLAHVKKLPLSGDFRVNMDRGSELAISKLSARDKKAVKEIGAHLKSRKVRLAAVDLIEGFVTDFNFTSPGLITQMEALLGENLARPIVQALITKRLG